MKFKLIIIIFIFPIFGFSQDTLKGKYVHLHLRDKSYFVSENINVDSLEITNGAKLYFNTGASIISNGYVLIKGTESKHILFDSYTGNSGLGFILLNNSNSNISIEYADFTNLTLPISFESGWFRNSVNISYNQFYKNVGTTALIQIFNPNPTITSIQQSSKFELLNNQFIDNRAPIYFEDFNSDIIKISISNNAFVNNTIYDYGKYTFSSNILYGRSDKLYSRYTATISNNSFYNNKLWDNGNETITYLANIGVYGSSDSILMQNNYWGFSKSGKLGDGIYDFSKNYTSPKLIINPSLSKPNSELPLHLYSILQHTIDNNQLSQLGYLTISQPKAVINENDIEIPLDYNLSEGIRSFSLNYNKKIDISNIAVILNSADDSLILSSKKLNPKLVFNNDSTQIRIIFDYNTDSLVKIKAAYLQIKGIRPISNEYLPEVFIGYYSYLLKIREFKKIRDLKINKLDSLKIDKILPVIIKNTTFKKRYELGFIGAYAIYYGTLSNKKLFNNDFNSLLGLQFRYSLKNHISLSVSFNKFTLTGTDFNSGDSLKVARGMSFKTPVTNLSFQIEYDFIDNRILSSRNRIRPSFGFGIDYIKFNPMGEYLGTWYNLQSLGTGGQNLPDSKTGPYQLSSLGAPITFQTRYYINKKTIFSLFATYHMAFTNYLDDVGPDPYPNNLNQALANPSNPDPAVYFSNPTNRSVNKGQLRSGLVDGSDVFFTFGFTLAHHF